MSFYPGETPNPVVAAEMPIERALRQLQTAFPAKVIRIDSEETTVDVDPAFHEVWRDGDDRRSEPLPVIPDVPLHFPSGGGFTLFIPPAVDDWVLVLCCKYSLEAWRNTARKGDPRDMGRFTLDGAVAIPGMFPNTPLPGGQNNQDTATFTIPDGQELHLGGYVPGASFVALADKVNEEFKKIWDLLTGGAEYGAKWTPPIPPASPDSGAALQTAAGARALSPTDKRADVDSQKVRSE